MLEPHRIPYNEQERGDIIPYLGMLDSLASASQFGQGLVEIFKGVGRLNLQDIELMLGSMNARTYLIGRDIANQPDFESHLPGREDQTLPYYLWTEGNWEANARLILGEEGISPTQNFERLGETGFLTLKRGTPLSRLLRSPSNSP